MSHALLDRSGSRVADEAVRDLASQLRGKVIAPGEAGYDEARRVFNAMVDRRPGLIVQPLDTAATQQAVRFARKHDLLVSIKGGGHSAPGHAVCDEGLLIDLASMNGVSVDPAARVAVAEGGATWGAFDEATQQHGLAVTGGRIRGTGVGGLTLGSGSGWLERKLGFTVDNLLRAEVVLATGEVVHASATENEDLFWGIRGGGGNFGIVTKFEYRLHPVGPIVWGGMIVFPRQGGKDFTVLQAYRDFMERAPDEVGGAAALITIPPLPGIPEEAWGTTGVAIIALYLGDAPEAERAFEPVLSLQPAVAMLQPMPYLAVQALLEESNQPGHRNYWKADNYATLPDEALQALIDASGRPPSPLTTVLLQPMGGAAARVPDDATAMGWRKAKWALHILGMWDDPSQDADQIKWVRDVAEALSPWAQKATYLNYLMDEGEARVKDSFGAHYQRLVALKDKYDPTNFFCMNQNIRPTKGM